MVIAWRLKILKIPRKVANQLVRLNPTVAARAIWSVCLLCFVLSLGLSLASYPGHVGGEKRPGIDCLHMCDHSIKNVESIVGKTKHIHLIYCQKLWPFAT